MTKLPKRQRTCRTGIEVSRIGKNFERVDYQSKREQPCSHYGYDPSQGKRTSKADERH